MEARERRKERGPGLLVINQNERMYIAKNGKTLD